MVYSRPRQTASREHGLTRWPSRSFEAVEEQTDVVMGKKRGVSMWTRVGILHKSCFEQSQGLGCDQRGGTGNIQFTHCLLQGAWRADGLLFMDVIWVQIKVKSAVCTFYF